MGRQWARLGGWCCCQHWCQRSHTWFLLDSTVWIIQQSGQQEGQQQQRQQWPSEHTLQMRSWFSEPLSQQQQTLNTYWLYTHCLSLNVFLDWFIALSTRKRMREIISGRPRAGQRGSGDLGALWCMQRTFFPARILPRSCNSSSSSDRFKINLGPNCSAALLAFPHCPSINSHLAVYFPLGLLVLNLFRHACFVSTLAHTCWLLLHCCSVRC